MIKQVDMCAMTNEEKDKAKKEARILGSLDHPNIIKFQDVYSTKSGKLNIVMDYAEGGDLL